MRKLALIVTVLLLALTVVARADERVLQWDNGVADLFIHQEQKSHFVLFETPGDWDKCFPVEAMFYGKRYGDVGKVKGTLVIWGPQTDATAKMEDNPDSLVIYYRKQFNLADVPETPGWFSVPIEIFEMPHDFAVSVFTYSTEERGLELGLTAEGSATSHSTSAGPEPVSLPGLKDPKLKSKVQLRTDGREWMVRIKVRPTLALQEAFTSEELTGSGFTVFDDGTAEDYLDVQKNGPMLHVVNDFKRKVDRVYVYAKVHGDWFNTDRTATVYLLDTRFNILSRAQLPYSRYTDQPGWSYVSFTNVQAPKEFFVLVAPNNRPSLGLLLGYDTSGKNAASMFGTPGAQLPWDVDAPVEKTNWMIRLQYK